MTPEVKERIEQIRHGNVPEGYKKGKYNVMPLGWSEEALSNLSDNITKGATPTTYGYTWVNDGVLFLKSDCVSDNGFVNREPVYISEDAHKMMNRSVVRAGDILISITGYLGKVGLVPSYIKEANINQHIARVRPLEDRCNPAFVYYYLDTNPIKRWFDVIQTGQAYSQLSLEQIREIKVPVPQITEQQRIAEILTAQDKVIELKEKRLAEKQRQKKYLMQQLLTGKKRLPGFDGKWNLKKISDISTYKASSITANSLETYSGDEIYPVHDANSIFRYVDFYESKEAYVSIVKDGAGAGRVALAAANSSVIGTMGYLYPTGQILVEYLYYFLASIDFSKYCNGSTIPHVYYKDYSLEKILLPCIKEQEQIVKVLAAADKEIDLLCQDLEQEKQKKKALMQLLLSGIVRV